MAGRRPAVSAGEGGLEAAAWWDDLYRRRYVSVVRLAGLLSGDYAEGEDIAQEAFARVFEAAGRVRDPDRFLTGTVVNLSRARRRKRHRRQAPRPVADAWSAGGFEDRVADQSVVLPALKGLSGRQREVVVLRYYDGLADWEIAEVLSVSVGSVKTHLHRAAATLAKTLEVAR